MSLQVRSCTCIHKKRRLFEFDKPQNPLDDDQLRNNRAKEVEVYITRIIGGETWSHTVKQNPIGDELRRK